MRGGGQAVYVRRRTVQLRDPLPHPFTQRTVHRIHRFGSQRRDEYERRGGNCDHIEMFAQAHRRHRPGDATSVNPMAARAGAELDAVATIGRTRAFLNARERDYPALWWRPRTRLRSSSPCLRRSRQRTPDSRRKNHKTGRGRGDRDAQQNKNRPRLRKQPGTSFYW